jgi:hypothetical protein
MSKEQFDSIKTLLYVIVLFSLAALCYLGSIIIYCGELKSEIQSLKRDTVVTQFNLAGGDSVQIKIKGEK